MRQICCLKFVVEMVALFCNAKCRYWPKRHFATVNCRIAKGSFDHVVGVGAQRLWHGEAECLGGVEVDEQLDLRSLLVLGSGSVANGIGGCRMKATAYIALAGIWPLAAYTQQMQG